MNALEKISPEFSIFTKEDGIITVHRNRNLVDKWFHFYLFLDLLSQFEDYIKGELDQVIYIQDGIQIWGFLMLSM